jgi:hypothetical protein
VDGAPLDDGLPALDAELEGLTPTTGALDDAGAAIDAESEGIGGVDAGLEGADPELAALVGTLVGVSPGGGFRKSTYATINTTTPTPPKIHARGIERRDAFEGRAASDDSASAPSSSSSRRRFGGPLFVVDAACAPTLGACARSFSRFHSGPLPGSTALTPPPPAMTLRRPSAGRFFLFFAIDARVLDRRTRGRRSRADRSAIARRSLVDHAPIARGFVRAPRRG